MFYSQYILAKQGPLGTIWIAAHSANAAKLRKTQIADTDLAGSCETIIHQTFNAQKVPLALRLSGQLLLGVVRIYARKLELLHRDSDEALVKIRQAFRGATVDLAPEALTAPLASITLPLDYDNLDFYADPTANYQLQLEPLARAGDINLHDPFMSSLLGYPQQDDEEFEYAPAGDDDDVAAERFRAMTPGSAARSAGGRSSLGGAAAKGGDAGGGVFDDYAALPLPADDEEEFVPMPEDDDGMGLGAAAPPAEYDDDVFGAAPGGTQPLGDSPRPRAATPGVSARGGADGASDDDAADADAPDETAAPRRGGRERAPAATTFGFAPATQAAEKETAGNKDKGTGGLRKRKFRVDDVIALTNAHIRAALADASDLLRPARAPRLGAPASRAAASVDDLLMAPACLSGGACAELRGLFARVPAAPAGRAARGAAAAAFAGAEAAGGAAAAAFADVDAAPIAEEEEDFGAGAGAGGWDDDGAGVAGSAPAPAEWDAAADDAAAAAPASAPRRGSAGSAPRLSAALEEEGDDADEARSDSEVDAAGDGAAPADDDTAGPADPAAWSKRTRNVLHVLQRSFAQQQQQQQPASRRSSAAADAVPPVQLQLAPMLEGETKGHAARMFFELLVLHTKGYVALQQPAPYADIGIAPTPKLVAAGL